MTPEQYRRWYTFALRMVHRGLGLRRRDHREYVADAVKGFFYSFESEMSVFPSLHEGVELLPLVRGWDQTDSVRQKRQPHPDGSCGFAPEPCRHGDTLGPFVCDLVSGITDDLCPYPWFNEPALEGGWRLRRWEDTWGDRIRSCIRAGIDMAVEPSAGVMGFTAGDLRRMYRGNVPDWITGGNEHRWSYALSNDGTGNEVLNGTFREMADDAGVLL